MQSFKSISHWLSIAVGGVNLLLVNSIAISHPIPSNYIARSPIAKASKPQVKTNFKYYSISGNTAAQLRQQMNRLGAKDTNENRRYDGATYWDLRWEYRYTYDRDFCRVSQAKVRVNINTVLPKWQPSLANNPALINRWNRYFKALKQHELGHHRHAVSAGQELLADLRNFRAYPNCHKLKEAIDFQGHTVITKYQQQDLQYDLLTDHGTRQGAVFP